VGDVLDVAVGVADDDHPGAGVGVELGVRGEEG
jgi:hypothetical protein